MPTSDILNVPAVVMAVTSFRPKSVLDIGCGYGKYGVLLREYTDVAGRRYERTAWQVRIEGIDGFADYRNPVWEAVYDRVHVGEAAALLPTLGAYDVALIADVIEHFEKPAAVDLVTKALAAAPAVVISTPHDFYPQGAEFGNELERHRCLWTAADTPPGAHCLTVPLLACNLFVVTRSPLPPRQVYPADWADLLYLRSRRKLRRLGPLGWPVAAAARAVNRVLS